MSRQMVSGCALLLCAFPGVGEANERPSLAVVAIGEDAREVGKAQQVLDELLGTDNRWSAVSAQATAARLAVAPSEKPTVAVSAAIEGDIGAAAEAVAAGDSKRALEKLDLASQALGSELRSGHALRVELELWRVGAYLAAKDFESARAAARWALLLDPELVVDLRRFWPSLAELVESVRAAELTVQIEVGGLPLDATLSVNGRQVANPYRALAGEHIIEASAPGFMTVAISHQASSDSSVWLPLPLAIEEELRAALLREFGSASAPLEDLLGQLTDRSAVTTLVVCRVDERGAQLIVFDREGGARVSEILSTLEPEPVRGWLAQPGPGRKVLEPAPPSALTASPSALWLLRLGVQPALFASDALTWSSTRVGVDRFGLRIVGGLARMPSAARSGWIVDAHLAAAAFSAVEVTSKGLENDDLDASGGWTAETRAGGGVALALAPRLRGEARAWASLEIYRLGDVSSMNERLGVLERYTRVSGGASLGFRLALGQVLLAAQLDIGLFNAFLARPRSPSDASVESEGRARAGGMWWLTRDWAIAADFTADLLSSDFGAAGPSTATPSPSQATRDEFSLALGVELHRRL